VKSSHIDEEESGQIRQSKSAKHRTDRLNFESVVKDPAPQISSRREATVRPQTLDLDEELSRPIEKPKASQRRQSPKRGFDFEDDLIDISAPEPPEPSILRFTASPPPKQPRKSKKQRNPEPCNLDGDLIQLSPPQTKGSIAIPDVDDGFIDISVPLQTGSIGGDDDLLQILSPPIESFLVSSLGPSSKPKARISDPFDDLLDFSEPLQRNCNIPDSDDLFLPISKSPMERASLKPRWKSCEPVSPISKFTPRSSRTADQSTFDEFPDLILFGDSPPRKPPPSIDFLGFFSPEKAAEEFSAKKWVHSQFNIPFVPCNTPEPENDDAVFAFQERLCSIIEVAIVADDGSSFHVFPTKLNSYLEKSDTGLDEDWLPVSPKATAGSVMESSDDDGDELLPCDLQEADEVPRLVAPPRSRENSRRDEEQQYDAFFTVSLKDLQRGFAAPARENVPNFPTRAPVRTLASALVAANSSDYSD
jgi:hypothetical protein